MFNCQIRTDILALEKETEGLLDEITGEVKNELFVMGKIFTLLSQQSYE